MMLAISQQAWAMIGIVVIVVVGGLMLYFVEEKP
jgi:hypothetical protein